MASRGLRTNLARRLPRARREIEHLFSIRFWLGRRVVRPRWSSSVLPVPGSQWRPFARAGCSRSAVAQRPRGDPGHTKTNRRPNAALIIVPTAPHQRQVAEP